MTAQIKRTRPRGFAAWTPRPDSLALVADVQAVLAEYQAHLPLTCRQIFYRLVAMKGFDKTETAYGRLTETIGRARRAGLVPFASIRDDGSARYELATWANPAHFLEAVRSDAEGFLLDRQAGQEIRLWVLCEAGGYELRELRRHRGAPSLFTIQRNLLFSPLFPPNDEGDSGFSPLLVRHSDDRDILHARMLEKDAFDLGRVDIDAA